MTAEPVALDAAVRAFVLSVVALAAWLLGWSPDLRALVDAVVISAVTLLSVIWTRQRVTPVDGPWVQDAVSQAYLRGLNSR